MGPNKMLDSLLNELEIEAENIPLEFITAGKITYFNGRTGMVDRKELAIIMNDDETPEEQGIREIRFLIDMDLVKKTIMDITENILTVKVKQS